MTLENGAGDVVTAHVEMRRLVFKRITQEILARNFDVAGVYAFALYHDLEAFDVPVAFNRELLDNRGVPTTNPLFFKNQHALEDFVGIVTQILYGVAGDDLGG